MVAMNFPAITRRIRRCESEVPAQLVLEYAISQAVAAEREECAKRVEKYMLEQYGNHYGVADAVRSNAVVNGG